MPNPKLTYALNLGFMNTFNRYTQLNDQTALFLTNQFNISQQSKMVPSIAMYH